MSTRVADADTVDWSGLHSLLAMGMIIAAGLHRGEPGYFEIIDAMKFGRPLPPECEEARDQCRQVLQEAMARLEGGSTAEAA